MPRDEAKTRRDLIDPAMGEKGWTIDLVEREVLAPTRDRSGKWVQRRADYVLHVRIDGKLRLAAVVEAKSESRNASDGMDQAVIYADALQAPVAISTNGKVLLWRRTDEPGNMAQSFEQLPNRSIRSFPTPVEMWNLHPFERGRVKDLKPKQAPLHSQGTARSISPKRVRQTPSLWEQRERQARNEITKMMRRKGWLKEDQSVAIDLWSPLRKQRDSRTWMTQPRLSVEYEGCATDVALVVGYASGCIEFGEPYLNNDAKSLADYMRNARIPLLICVDGASVLVLELLNGKLQKTRNLMGLKDNTLPSDGQLSRWYRKSMSIDGVQGQWFAMQSNTRRGDQDVNNSESNMSVVASSLSKVVRKVSRVLRERGRS